MLEGWKRFEPWTLAALRIMAAFMFWQHGAQKLLGVLGREAAVFPTLPWFAGVLEFFGAILIALGLLTRPVAFLLSGQMAVAYFMAHAPRGFWTVQNRGETAVLYCFLFLFLAAYGPGRLALDNLVFGKSESEGEADT